MTELDADRLYEIHGPDRSRHILLKLVRYYENKLRENPKSAKAYYRIGTSLAEMGYINSEKYSPQYLRDAIANLDLAIQHAPTDESLKYLRKKINYLIYSNDLVGALAVFKILYEKSPKAFETYMSAAKIALKQKKASVAEQWLKSAVTAALTEENKEEYHRMMVDLRDLQGRPLETIPHYEFIAQKNSTNAWAWHNLGIAYSNAKDYDKAIEFGLKAIAINEFGAARHMLSRYYYSKSMGGSAAAARNPASVAQKEDLLLQSIKYDGKNAEPLYALAKVYIDQYLAKPDPVTLSKAKTYGQQAAQAAPDSQQIVQLLLSLQDIEKMNLHKFK